MWENLGGLARNRTGVQGFAVLCVATPPRGLRRGEPRCVLISNAQANSQGRTCPAGCKPGVNAVEAVHKKRKPPVAKKKTQNGFAKLRELVICPSSLRRRSPIAQLVEHSTVNRIVAGSSPARGANFFNTLLNHSWNVLICLRAVCRESRKSLCDIRRH